MLLLALIAAADAREQDVLVPEFTPATISDFAISYLVYNSMVETLRARGVDVVDAEEIRARSGQVGDACADFEACPGVLFDDFPARLAVVGRAGQAGDGLDLTVEVYDPANSSPLKTMSEVVDPGAEDAFYARVADLVQEVLPLVAPREPPEDTPPPIDFEPFEPDELKPPPDATFGDDRAALRVGERGYERYLASGLAPEDWADRVRLRSGMISLEVGAGVGLGNTGRVYDVRVAVDVGAGEDVDLYQYDALASGGSLQAALGLGYHPTAWLEVGLIAGLQRGDKGLSFGWESYDGEDLVESFECTGDACGGEPVSTWAGIIEPRARFLILPTSALKPYGLAGISLRLLDGYQVPESGLVDYPSRPGGTVLDLVVGAGAAYDFTRNVGLFFEIPFGYSVTGASTYTTESSLISAVPEPAEAGAPYLLRLSAGVQTRF